MAYSRMLQQNKFEKWFSQIGSFQIYFARQTLSKNKESVSFIAKGEFVSRFYAL